MQSWSLDILRQSGVDLWTWVCVAASAVLVAYALVGKPWRSARGWAGLGIVAAAVAGTVAVVAVPEWRSAKVGLGWTFVLLSLVSTAFYLNLVDQLGPRRTGALLGLRVAALALLVTMLFEPVIRYVKRPTAERPLVVLVDASGSMSFPDVQNGPTRIQSVWQTLRPQVQGIGEHFVPRFYTFAGDVRELKKPEDLSRVAADGQATDLVGAISRALVDNPRQDAAFILVSDGIDNVSPNVVDAIRASTRKINTIGVGSELAEPAALANVAVDSIAAEDDFAVGHESAVTATIKSSALPNRLVDVKLAEVDDAGKPVGPIDSQKLVLQPVGKGQEVKFAYKPQKVGVHKLAVWIDPIPGERSTADNRQEFQALAVDPRIKVLYVEGRLRPEYRYLNRALGHDPNVEESTLVRLQQDKFAAAGEGAGEQLKALPTTAEQWRKFDVIILGDLDASFLTRAQQAAVEQAVKDGSGLLMIGGQDNFGPGGYQGTPIENALPVFAGDVNAPQEKSEFVPAETAAGSGHPILEGLDAWFPSPGKRASKELPPLRGNIVVGAAKTGADVLLTHADRPGPGGSPQVVLAVQRYGKGRSAAFTADTTYLWYLSLRDAGQESPYNRLWGQMVRWLADADVRNRQSGAGIEGLLTKSVYRFGETVKVRALVRDDKGDATKFAQVKATLKPAAGGEAKEMPLSPVASHTGMYEALIPDAAGAIPALGKGDYALELVAEKDGKELGRQTLKFSVIPPADEMLKIAANPQLLRQIAETTGGFYRPLDGLPGLIEQLIKTDPASAGALQVTVPLHNTARMLLAAAGLDPQWPTKYDLPMQGGLVIALLATEWILRRKWQLP